MPHHCALACALEAKRRRRRPFVPAEPQLRSIAHQILIAGFRHYTTTLWAEAPYHDPAILWMMKLQLM